MRRTLFAGLPEENQFLARYRNRTEWQRSPEVEVPVLLSSRWILPARSVAAPHRLVRPRPSPTTSSGIAVSQRRHRRKPSSRAQVRGTGLAASQYRAPEMSSLVTLATQLRHAAPSVAVTSGSTLAQNDVLVPPERIDNNPLATRPLGDEDRDEEVTILPAKLFHRHTRNACELRRQRRDRRRLKPGRAIELHRPDMRWRAKIRQHLDAALARQPRDRRRRWRGTCHQQERRRKQAHGHRWIGATTHRTTLCKRLLGAMIKPEFRFDSRAIEVENPALELAVQRQE